MRACFSGEQAVRGVIAYPLRCGACGTQEIRQWSRLGRRFYISHDCRTSNGYVGTYVLYRNSGVFAETIRDAIHRAIRGDVIREGSMYMDLYGFIWVYMGLYGSPAIIRRQSVRRSDAAKNGR